MTAPPRSAAPAVHATRVAGRPDRARGPSRDGLLLRLEAQADAAAHAVLRGERDVARRLAPAPPSGFTVSTSRGEPIPALLRVELERGFGTTLGDVRIHRDDAAARAAALLGAAAFVSGLDVYFGERRFDPEGARGRELVAHEIAHVLQQRVPGGRPAAGPDGSVLRRDLSLEFTARGLFETAPSLDDIVRLHLDASPTDVELRTHTERVSTLLGSARPAHPAAAELIALTAERDFTKEQAHLAFYFDALKAIGEHRAAAKVVKFTFPALTAVPLNSFYSSTLRRDAEWVSRTLRAHALTGTYWPRRFVDTIRIFLFGPGRPEQDLGTQRPFADTYDDALNAADSPEALVASERFFYGLAALKELDDWRLGWQREVRQAVDRNDRQRDRTGTRIGLAEFLADTATLTKMADLGGLSVEARRLFDAVVTEIAAVAAAARDFWMRVADLDAAFRKGGAFGTLGAAAEIIGEIRTVRTLRGLEDDLLRVARAIFLLPSGRTPSQGAYSGQLEGARRQVLGLTNVYDQTLIALQRRAADGEVVSDRLMLQHGWVVSFLTQLHLRLGMFEPMPRRKGETPAEQREREDHLVLHRLLLARDLERASLEFGFEELGMFLIQVLTAMQRSQKESEFAVAGDWAEDINAKPSEIVRDFPAGATLVGAEPLTIDDLARFNYALYAGDLTTKLREILSERGAVHSKGMPPIVNQALDAIETRDRPRRWLLTEYVAAIRPEERDRFGLMIGAHPKYRDFLATKKPAGHEVVFPYPYAFHQGGLVLWTVPQLDKLVTKLKGIPGLDNGVRTVLGGEAPDALAWLGALKQVIELDPSIDAAAIRAFIEADFDAAVAELDVELRRATSHQRRVLLEHVLLPLWNAYASNDIHTFTRPLEAIRVMTDFAGHVQPPTDQRLQMAALVTELGPLLYEKLGPQDVLFGLLETNVTGRLDIIVMLLPHLEGTLALAADEATKGTLLKLDLHVPKGFDFHVGEVRNLKEGTAEHLFEVQTETRLAGSQKGNSLSSPGHGYPFLAGPDNAIQIDGIEYELVEVYESFTYAPGVAMAAGGVDWPASKLGESKLWDSSGTEVATEARAARSLFKIKRFDREVVVTGADDWLLSELTYAVTMNAIVTQLVELEALLRKAAELGLDLAELIPGWGQAIMVARFITSVLTFVTSEQFQDLKRALGGDSEELIKQAFAKLEEVVTPEKLWDWLLFGGGALPTVSPLDTTDRQKKVAKRHRKGSAADRLKALVERLLRIGQNLGRRVGALADRFRYPVRRTELFVQSRPMIAMVLRLMVDNYARLSNLKLAELELGPDIAQKRILDEMGQLSARISELLETISELELPQEIIPLDQIVDVTLEIVTDHLGGKYRKGVQIIKAGLQRIPGAWEGIVAAITEQLEAAGMNPNRLWQDLVRSDLEPRFEKLAGDFAETAGGTLARIPFLKGVTPPAGPTVDLTLEEGEFPETQPYLDGEPERTGAALSWPTDAGRPLDPRYARQASLAFGADLSHVRVHTGAAAATLTGRLGARAVTSGSHVYLRPGLSIEHGPGAQVFRHELAHVVQQTGPRPLGASAGDAPVAGLPDRGMQLSDAAEHAADRAAEVAGREPVARRPLDVGSRRGPAVQPSLDPRIEPVLKKFFGKLGADKPLTEFVEEIERGPRGKAQLDARATKIKSGLPAKLDAELKELKSAGGKASFEKPFNSAHVEIAKYVDENHRFAIGEAVAALLVASMKPKQVKSRTASGGTKQTTEWHFDHKRFEVNLEEYMLGRSGVLFDIEFNLDRTGPGASMTEPMIDLDRPFSTFKVLAVNFAYLGGTANLWDLIVQNTWETRTYVPGSKFKDLPLPEARALYKNRARMLIRSAGPDPRLFHSTEFRFSDDFVKRVEEAAHPIRGGLLPPERLPSWKEYLEAEPRNRVWHDTGYAALKHGIYEQAKEGGEQWGLEREAHHPVPYLLLEYFRNKKANKPFPRALSWYPGVVTSGGGLVERIEKRGGARSIKVGDYEDLHGGKMPTVLISRHTHQLGRLHLDPKPDDAPGARPTQGGAVHATYGKRLGGYEPIVLGGSSAKLEAVKKQSAGQKLKDPDAVIVGGKPVTLDMLQDAIYDAVVRTYTWVRDDMLARLRAGLAKQEVEYYTATAKRSTQVTVYQPPPADRLKPAYKAVPKDTEAVASQAEQDVKRIMEDPSLAGFEEKT